MGLDMYLRAEKYISGYAPEAQKTYQDLLDLSGMREAADPETPSATVRVMVAYWRKANAIHRWFVENVQEGVDDCRDYYVSREQLGQLRAACRQALAVAQVSEGQPVHNGTTWYPDGKQEEHFVEGRALLNGEEIAKILPTQGGFFFGSTDYDEWYIRDLEDTIKQIDRVLKALPEDADLYYEASW